MNLDDFAFWIMKRIFSFEKNMNFSNCCEKTIDKYVKYVKIFYIKPKSDVSL